MNCLSYDLTVWVSGTCSPKNAPSHKDLGLLLILGFLAHLCPHTKWHLSHFSRFCRAYHYVQHTGRLHYVSNNTLHFMLCIMTHTHTRLTALFPGLPGWAGRTGSRLPRRRLSPSVGRWPSPIAFQFQWHAEAACATNTTYSVIGVSRPLVLDCGMTFHLDSGGRDLPWTLSDNLWKLIYLVTEALSDSFWIYKRYINKSIYLSIYQKGKTNLDFTEARDSEWQWHQLGHMQACT